MVKRSKYKQSRFGNLHSFSQDMRSEFSDSIQNSNILCSSCGFNSDSNGSLVFKSSNLVIKNISSQKNSGHKSNKGILDFHQFLLFSQSC